MFELRITMSPAGEIAVTGPIDNLMVCYGLLESAKDVIREHHAAKTKIAPATGADLLALSGHRG